MKWLQHHALFFISLLFVCSFANGTASFAQGGRNIQIIRDIEIESILKEWSTPIFEAADLTADQVDIILVQSPQINAFVSGGANIFIYTGLIEETEDPGELIGVIAHEVGHIAAGHLVGTRAALKRASYESILSAALGIGAAILTGDGRAGSAIALGGQGVATSRFLSQSRVHESSADQAAVKFMEEAGMNPEGLVSFFRKLQDQELLPASQQVEYVRTHPLTQNRIESIVRKTETSPHLGKPWPDNWLKQHARMRAKLVGFINPNHVVWRYNDRDQSFSARYARTIAAYRSNKLDQSLVMIDDLLEEEPENSYLHELKGQMLVDYSRVEEALPSLQKAVDLRPKAGLFRIALAQALIQDADNKERLKQGIDHLEFALIEEPRSTRARRFLAIAYGNLGNDLMARVNLAEEAVLQHRRAYAQDLIKLVLKDAESGSRAHTQAIDLQNYLDSLKDS